MTKENVYYNINTFKLDHILLKYIIITSSTVILGTILSFMGMILYWDPTVEKRGWTQAR